MSVAGLLARLWRAKYWALAGAALSVAAALAFGAVAKPSYEANALVYIDPQDLQLLQNDISSRPPSGDSGAMFVESQSRIMQSEEVLRGVVMKLGLLTDPEFAGKASSGAGDAELQGTIDNLSAAVRVVHADRTYVVEIYARSQDAQKSATIANAVVDSYLAVREEQRAQQASAATAAIQKRLAELGDDVTTKEQAVERFKADHGLVSANGQDLLESRLNDANGALSAALRAVNDAKTNLSQIELATTNLSQFLSSPAAMASADLARLRDAYDQATAALETESATLGPKHPTVIRAKAQVKSASQAIAAMAAKIKASAKLQYDKAQADYAAAGEAVQSLTTAYQVDDGAQVQLRQLQRDADSSKAVYEDALLRSRQTREQEQINTANVQVISPATAPLQKRFPPRPGVLAPLAAGMGLALGLGAYLALGVLLPADRRKAAKAGVAAAEPPQPPAAAPPPPGAKAGLRRLAALPDREGGAYVN